MTTGDSQTLLTVGFVLLVLVAALGLLSRAVRRRTEGHQPRDVRLTASHRVHVVEIEGRRLLVGTGPDSAPRFLADLGAEAAAEPSTTAVHSAT